MNSALELLFDVACGLVVMAWHSLVGFVVFGAFGVFLAVYNTDPAALQLHDLVVFIQGGYFLGVTLFFALFYGHARMALGHWRRKSGSGELQRATGATGTF